MPRSRGRSAPAAPRAQTRSAHTMSAPATHAPPQHVPQPAQVQQRQPGLFSQMASTAAGVAVGSAAGHTIANGISGLFGGGSREAPVEYQQQQQPMQSQTQGANCDVDARQLTSCLDQNNGDMRLCQWYADQLKSCLSASSTF